MPDLGRNETVLELLKFMNGKKFSLSIADKETHFLTD